MGLLSWPDKKTYPLLAHTGWSIATVFYNISLTGIELQRNGKTQQFLLSLDMDILIFQCLINSGETNPTIQGYTKTVWILHSARDEHPDNPLGTQKHIRHQWLSLIYPHTILQTPSRFLPTTKDATHANRHQGTSTGTFSHPQTTPGSVCGCLGVSVGVCLVSVSFCWNQLVYGDVWMVSGGGVGG